jgi:uncharacterized cupin superfamily protein
VSEVPNVFDAPRVPKEGTPAGYALSQARIGPLVGATQLGMTVYELSEGNSICPYHYEYPCEEWLIVLEGNPVLRDPDGEHDLEPGDVVCFPPGPEGAHKVTNRRHDRSLVAMLSTKSRPGVAVYPDSGKVGVVTGDDSLFFPRAAAVDYWLGE